MNVRLAWVSDRARDVWAPRMERVRQAWSVLEIESVRRRQRPCALVVLPAYRIFDVMSAAANDGLVVESLQSIMSGLHLYVRVGIGRREDVNALRGADDLAVARMLGYPHCCIEFFRAHWYDRNEKDLTFATAAASARDAGDLILAVPLLNTLLRWIEIRLIPHMPCAFDCPASVANGRAFADLGKESGFGQEMEWAEEMLSWPMEWSALHGIAEVRTPVLKFMAETDPTDRKRLVRIAGAGYPAEGARGITFPYSRSTLVDLRVARG